MDNNFVMTMIFLIVLITIQLTLNKILQELRNIRIKIDKLENDKIRKIDTRGK